MTYQLKNTPPDIRKILIREQANQMKEKNKIISREFVMYKIIREWEEMKAVKKLVGAPQEAKVGNAPA